MMQGRRGGGRTLPLGLEDDANLVREDLLSLAHLLDGRRVDHLVDCTHWRRGTYVLRIQADVVWVSARQRASVVMRGCGRTLGEEKEVGEDGELHDEVLGLLD